MPLQVSKIPNSSTTRKLKKSSLKVNTQNVSQVQSKTFQKSQTNEKQAIINNESQTISNHEKSPVVSASRNNILHNLLEGESSQQEEFAKSKHKIETETKTVNSIQSCSILVRCY